MNNNIRLCCKDCPDRKYKCHSVCEKYKRFKAENEIEKKAQKIQRGIENAYYVVRYERRDKLLASRRSLKSYRKYR